MTRKRNTNGRASKPVRYRYPVPTKSQKNALAADSVSKDHDHVVALSNPFSPQAVGAKIPDENSTKSVAVTVHDTFYMATSATGYADARVVPNIGYGTVRHAATSGSAGVVTWAAEVDLTDAATYRDAFDSYRIVGWGIRVYNTLAPTQQSGVIRIITCPEDPATGGGAYITNGGLHEAISVYPASSEAIHWISKAHGTEWRDYRKFTGSELPWDAVHIRYEGGPASATNAIAVEMVFHLECQVELGTISATMASPAADHKPHVLAAASKTLAKHGGTHVGHSFGGLISRFAKSALSGVVNHFLPGFIPRPTAYPMIQNVD